MLVSASWMGLLVARSLGYPVETSLIAMLMGGSVVGIAYTLGKRLTEGMNKAWKLTAIPLGFLLVYAGLSGWWLVAGIAAVAAAGAVAYFFRVARRALAGAAQGAELEEKMKDCC